MLNKNDVTMGNYVNYLMNKEKFEKVSKHLVGKIREKQARLTKYLTEEISFIESEDFIAIKDKLCKLNICAIKVERSPEFLFDIHLSEIIELLGLEFDRKGLEDFLGNIEELVK